MKNCLLTETYHLISMAIFDPNRGIYFMIFRRWSDLFLASVQHYYDTIDKADQISRWFQQGHNWLCREKDKCIKKSSVLSCFKSELPKLSILSDRLPPSITTVQRSTDLHLFCKGLCSLSYLEYTFYGIVHYIHSSYGQVSWSPAGPASTLFRPSANIFFIITRW